MTLHDIGEPEMISVIVPAFNAEATLAATLASIAHQTHRQLEILVVDDGSTDGTAGIIAEAVATDGRIIGVSYGRNRGRSAARNAGIERATGAWLAFVDADDLLHERRFEAMLDAAAAEPGCRIVTDDRWGFTVDSSGSVAMQHRFPARHTWRVGGSAPLDRARHFTDRFGHLDVLVERSYVAELGVTFPEDLAIGEDLAFYLTLLFSSPDPHPARVAAGSYFYRLAPTGRDAGAADTWQHIIDLVVERTGSNELRELATDWQPIHSYLFERGDRTLAAEGRLGERRVPRDPRVTPSTSRGLAWLISVKGLQWLGRFVDRRVVGATAADIEQQLQRTLG